MDSNWQPIGFNQEDLKETVTHIHACAYQDDRADTGNQYGVPANHWILSLEITTQRSVRIDMNPLGLSLDFGRNPFQGQVQVSSKTYRHTERSIHTLSFPTKDKTMVKDIVDLINKNGLQVYTFSPEFKGCRYWVYKVVSHLEEEGIIDSGSADQTWRAIPYFYMPSGRIESELKKGTFGPVGVATHSNSVK
ncbi:hypothetical protein E4U57_004216 [Claviceps arundinis]|uniref:DUF7770 domain-containing protein n=1 Tax=Claviceps arundinis TaxID=1623583 RepID=A0ABQ7P5L7_9HYPO|nr:hypothetical protein E4U57_004216 [Claviceps arundinis]